MTIDVGSMLDGLGTTPIEVANTLANKGVQGFRSEPEMCPIAVYLSSQGVRNVHVDAAQVKWWDGDDVLNGEETPRHIAQFIEQFDEGKYSFLEPDDE